MSAPAEPYKRGIAFADFPVMTEEGRTKYYVLDSSKAPPFREGKPTDPPALWNVGFNAMVAATGPLGLVAKLLDQIASATIRSKGGLDDVPAPIKVRGLFEGVYPETTYQAVQELAKWKTDPALANQFGYDSSGRPDWVATESMEKRIERAKKWIELQAKLYRWWQIYNDGPTEAAVIRFSERELKALIDAKLWPPALPAYDWQSHVDRSTNPPTFDRWAQLFPGAWAPTYPGVASLGDPAAYNVDGPAMLAAAVDAQGRYGAWIQAARRVLLSDAPASSDPLPSPPILEEKTGAVVVKAPPPRKVQPVEPWYLRLWHAIFPPRVAPRPQLQAPPPQNTGIVPPAPPAPPPPPPPAAAPPAAPSPSSSLANDIAAYVGLGKTAIDAVTSVVGKISDAIGGGGSAEGGTYGESPPMVRNDNLPVAEDDEAQSLFGEG